MDDIRETIATALREEWPKISKDIRHHCINPMPARIQAVVDARIPHQILSHDHAQSARPYVQNRSGIQLHFELSYIKI
jgi:hypothetical protein